MSAADDSSGLTIGDLASRAGVGEGTLRMWESRYGFPAPRRLPSGHRRYSEQDLSAVMTVLRARAAGLPLAMAIDRARKLETEPGPSVYGALRERFTHLHPQLLRKPALVWMSRAIEDECCSRAPRPLLFACFQQERFYRRVEKRWRELARGSERAVVLADFPRLRRPRGAPAEVPIHEDDPLIREWVVVCDAPQLSACVVGWERPSLRGEERAFETIWSVEPSIVREAARVCCELTARAAAEVVEDLRERLADPPDPGRAGQVRAAMALATRITLYASEAYGSRAPRRRPIRRSATRRSSAAGGSRSVGRAGGR